MSTPEAAGTARSGLVVMAGGLLIGLAYAALPAGASPGGGLLTAPQLGDMDAMVGVPSLALLSLVPILAAVIFCIGGWFMIVKPVGQAVRIGGTVLLGCAGLATVTYMFPLVQVTTAMGMPLGLSLTASGFWVTVLGLGTTAGGALLQLRDLRAPRE